MKAKLKKILFQSVIMIIIASGCTLGTTEPPPVPDPNVDLSTALVVNTYRDTFDGNCTSNDCSLRDAVYQANNTSADEILLPRGTYLLNERILRNDDSGRYGDLDITSRITIQGEGIDLSVIDGAHKDRIFHVLQGGALTLHDLTLLNGKGDDPPFTKPKGTLDTILDCVFSLFSDCGSGTITNVLPDDFEHIIAVRGGGAIANSGTLVLNQVTIEYNLSLSGGGIANYGTAEINGGRICNNQGRVGGGIYNKGNLKINGAQICYNNRGKDPADWPSKFGGKPGFQNTSILDLLPPYKFDGNIYVWGGGGGIYNHNGATLFITNSVISNNDANAYASALWNVGTATLEAIRITENVNLNHPAILNQSSFGVLTIRGGENGYSIIARNEGPALLNFESATATITDTLIMSNSSYLSGAVSNFEGADLTISQSMISDNFGQYGPGGIGVMGGTVKLTNVSIGLNQGATDLNTVPFKDSISGMGSFYIQAGQAELINVTIFDNNTYGLVQVGGRVTILNTIVAYNGLGNWNCLGTIISLGFNLDNEDTCKLNILGDLPFTNPLINPTLDASTRYTYTIPAHSPARDAGDIQNCPTRDQQGQPRPIGLGCDIGAYENQETIANPLETIPDSFQPPAVDPADELAPPPVAPPPTQPPVEPPPTQPPTDPINAKISGAVWNDANGNKNKDGGETGLAVQLVKLGSGACQSSGLSSLNTDFGGGYSFTGLAAGTYCVSVERPLSCGDITSATTPKEVTINLKPGEQLLLSFGFQKYIC